jgi:hypothetical protein
MEKLDNFVNNMAGIAPAMATCLLGGQGLGRSRLWQYRG